MFYLSLSIPLIDVLTFKHMYCDYNNGRWRLIEEKWTLDLKLFSFMSQFNVIYTFFIGAIYFL